MSTVLLAVHVLSFLTSARSVSTPQIHAHLADLGFQRTPRSIQRLMDELCTTFEIERDDSSKPYGYRWKPNSRGLGLPALADREALVLLLAHQQLQPLLPAGVMRALDPLFDEARRRLDPYSGQKPLRSWPSKVAVVSQLQPLIPPKLAAGVFEAVTEALQSDQWLDVDYRNFQGEQQKGKRVMPLALVQQGARLFVVCQFEAYQDRRHLALHRISRARLTGQWFDRPEFDLASYVRDGRFGFGTGERIHLRLRVSPVVAELLKETPVATDQLLTPLSDGRSELVATVVLSEQLRWWLRTYGSAVEVVDPRGLLDDQAAGLPRA